MKLLISRGWPTMLRIRGAAFHSNGIFAAIERATAAVPSLAMILIVLARKPN